MKSQTMLKSTSDDNQCSKKRSMKLTMGFPLLCCGAQVLETNDHQLPLSSSSFSSSTSSSFRRRDRAAELLEVFRHFDRDHDGRISSNELRMFFSSVGDEMDAEDAEKAISELDSDGDRLLDFQDFVVLMEKEEEEDLRRAFGMFEAVKGSGRITSKGLKRMLSRLGDERSDEECKAMIRAYDLDGDGELDFNEFHHMMVC